MAVLRFPDVELADPNGLLAIGGDLEAESLLTAYKSGIFPWPIIDGLLTWFAPPQRAVLFLDHFHMPKSLKKAQRQSSLSFAVDRNFQAVIEQCSQLTNRGTQDGTWITPEVRDAYYQLHRSGFCHSFEAYEDNQLVGGLYGVSIGKMFAGESMFYRKPNASKLTFCFLVEHLRKQGAAWIDCQMITPLTESFGAVEIERKEFMQLLAEAVKGEKIQF